MNILFLFNKYNIKKEIAHRKISMLPVLPVFSDMRSKQMMLIFSNFL